MSAAAYYREPLARATAVCKTYEAGSVKTPVLFDISLDIYPGELTLLMGPSGSGKTTLISILAGLLRPSAGSVELCGEALTGMGEAAASRVRRRQVGFVFQQYNLFPALSALDNVAEVLHLKGMARRQARAEASEALARVGLADRLTYLPDQLSGGQKQRVAIARALAGGPSIVFGDEVTGALDGTTALAIMDIIHGFLTPSRAMLIVTHDHRLEKFAERIITMEDGRIVTDTRRKGPRTDTQEFHA